MLLWTPQCQISKWFAGFSLFTLQNGIWNMKACIKRCSNAFSLFHHHFKLCSNSESSFNHMVSHFGWKVIIHFRTIEMNISSNDVRWRTNRFGQRTNFTFKQMLLDLNWTSCYYVSLHNRNRPRYAHQISNFIQSWLNWALFS